VSHLRAATDGRIATVTIDRPRQRNAMTLAMWREMTAIFARLSEDPAIGAIVLAGAGDADSTSPHRGRGFFDCFIEN
jgi:enoyl-CoA hydratase/carnithine racemase